ncbi:MAG: hypothetical protein J0L96_14395 [Anaerolineae bacterium]|nr:hypothetical protein [Anaerolineae bacterium]
MTSSIDSSNTISSELILESIRKIRSYPFQESQSRGERTVLPISYIAWLRNKLQADTIIIYLYTTEGMLQQQRRIGQKVEEIRLVAPVTNSYVKRLKNLKRTDARFTFSELADKNRLQDGLSPCFGYIAVYKEIGFDPSQVALLDQIAHFLGDYITNRTRIFVLRRSAKIQQELISIAQDNKTKPGTKLARALAKIDGSVDAAYSFFCTIYQNECYIEYCVKPWYRGGLTRAKVIQPSPPSRLSEAFIEKCKEGHIFFWAANADDFPLEPMLDVRTNFKDEIAHFFIIVPILSNKVPIAAFIFAFASETIYFDRQSSISTLDFTTRLFQRSIEHLFQRRSQAMIINPIFRGRNATVNDKSIFVLMPFSEPWSDRIWTKLIKPICIDAGMNPIRADDLFGRDIMEDVWQSICSARIVIADITGRNPNVFYELGLAHTLGKEVVLLTQDVKDIPFDLNRYRHIIYQDNMDGYEKLKAELSSTISSIL